MSDEPEMTERMKQVLDGIAKGWKNHEIGAELGIGIKTVEKHRSALYEAYKVDNAVSLVVAAHKAGVITL